MENRENCFMTEVDVVYLIDTAREVDRRKKGIKKPSQRLQELIDGAVAVFAVSSIAISFLVWFIINI